LVAGVIGSESLKSRPASAAAVYSFSPRENLMSHHDHHDTHQEPHRDPDPADSRADTIAAFFAIAIAVSGVLFFVANHN
jgi:hypothetical protein